MLRAVLDANVFVSAAICPPGAPGRLIRELLARGAFGLVATPAIVAEVRRALGYAQVRERIAPGLDAQEWVLDVMALADMVDDGSRARGVSRDPADDVYVAAALQGRAAFVVTGDRDLLALREHEGVLFVTPRAFLGLLER